MTINSASMGKIIYRKDQGEDECIAVIYKDDWSKLYKKSLKVPNG